MAERDRFELDLAAALRTFAEDAPTEVRPTELARHFAMAYPGGRGAARRWGFGLTPALAWTLLLAGLLLALVVGGLMAGARRPDQAIVVAPSPMPSPTVIAAERDILATTKARLPPAQATCPAGSDPDAPGPADQARPRKGFSYDHPFAFDRRAGRIVLLDFYSWPGTWTFDVCTNTWQQMQPDQEPPSGDAAWLAYDADSDRTVALVRTRSRYELWAYDLAADHWTRGGSLPGPVRPLEVGPEVGLLYDPVSGLLVLRHASTGEMWAYDVESDAWTRVRQGADMPRVLRSDGQADRQVLGYDGSADRFILWVDGDPTWTFDPRAGRWTQGEGHAELWFAFAGSGTASAYDEAAALAIFISGAGENQWAGVLAYDAAQDAWKTLWLGTPCLDSEVTYDAVNGRTVCFGVSPVATASPEPAGEFLRRPRGMVAFDARAGRWITLLEPVRPMGQPVPTPGS